MVWKIFGAVIIVLAVIIAGYYVIHDSPKKFYRKARRAHKAGEDAYNSAEFDLADEYYSQANEFRQRAQELE
jgi:uncharacterized protein (UPF0333 family)